MKNLYILEPEEENKDIENFVMECIEKNEEIIYILPTVEAIEKIKRSYIDKLGGFINLTFHTFDSLRKILKRSQNIDEPFSLYIISNILKKNKYKNFDKITDGLIEKINNFIKRAREEGLDFEKLKANSSGVLNEISDIAIKYLIFLNEHNLFDGNEFEDIKGNDKIKNIVVDGFYTFKKIDLLTIEALKNADIIINMPYYFKDFKIIKEVEEEILSLGFKKVSAEKCSDIEERLAGYKNKISFIVEENENKEAFAVYQELKYQNIINDIPFSRMGIVYANENNSLLNYMKDENMDFDIKSLKVRNSPVIREFEDVLDFAVDSSYDNIFRRIDSYYFNITDCPEDMEYILRQLKFKNLDELKEEISEEIRVEEGIKDEDFKNIMILMEELSKCPEKYGTFEYFSDYFSGYFLKLEERISEIYEETGDTELLIRDMNISSKIEGILEKIKLYNSFFGRETLENYISIVKLYLKDMVVKHRNGYAASYSSLIEALCLDYDVLFIMGLTESYPIYKEKNFIFSKENKEKLKRYGMKSEDDLYIYENEIIKILSLMENSDRIYMSTSSKESHSIILDLFMDEADEKIVKSKATNKNDLFLEIMRDYKAGRSDEKKIADLNAISDIGILNSLIYGENNRDGNEYDGYLSGNALKIVDDILDKKYLSPTAIDNYIECPMYFLFKNIFDVEEMNREYDDKFYMELGNLYHRVLERYFKKCPADYKDMVLHRILFEEMFPRRAYGEELSGFEEMKFKYHFDELEEFIDMDLNKRNGAEPEYFEYKFKFNIEDMKLNGIIDRVDSFKDKKVVIDYKTGTPPTIGSVLEGEKYQLPIYALAMKDTVHAKYGRFFDNRGYVNVFLNHDIVGGRKSKGALKDSEYREFLENTKDRLLKIYSNMKSGYFPFKELNKEYQKEFNSLSRGE